MFLSDLDESWDLIVVGGGITGAGILLAASRMGPKGGNDYEHRVE